MDQPPHRVLLNTRTGRAHRPLRDLAAELSRLADTADDVGGPRETYERYGRSMAAERLAAEQPGWADDRSFTFQRSLAASPEQVWRHLTEPDLLAQWWTPDDLRVSELVFDALPGGRVVLEYRAVDDADGTDLVVGRAEGVVDVVRPAERLTHRSSPLLPDGGAAFTAHVDLGLRPTGLGAARTDLEVRYGISDSTVDSADFVAGIKIGFGQSLDKLAALLAADTDRTSTSVIKALLAADQVDRLALGIFPIFLGDGPRPFDDGLPAEQWELVSQTPGEHGTLMLVYDRVH